MTTPSVLTPSIFESLPAVVAAISTRRNGKSAEPFGMNLSFRVGDNPEHVRENREFFFGSLGIALDQLAVPEQVHGTTVVTVRAPGIYPECDALITSAREVYLCVTVADCVPILLCDPRAGTIAAVHAGWRGTAGKILLTAVRRMREEFDVRTEDLLAYLGPAAGGCCYEVGGDVASHFEPEFVAKNGGGFLLDLKAANRRLLTDAGVPPENIEVSNSCTITDSALFHSYRRDRERSGRMMGVIGLRGTASLR